MNLVLDCSFIITSLLGKKEANNEGLESYNIYVPSLFYLECNNVLLNSLKRSDINQVQYQEKLNIIKELPVTVDSFSFTSYSLNPISKLAQKYNLTSYDASYLELAIRIDGKIASFDKALLKAAKLNGIESFLE